MPDVAAGRRPYRRRMTILAPPEPATEARPRTAGPVGRLGAFAADHARAVMTSWAVVLLVLAVFAPRVETSLSGAGWQADGSESVRARDAIQRSSPGLASSALTVVVHGKSSPELSRAVHSVERVLGGDPRVAGVTTSRTGDTAIV